MESIDLGGKWLNAIKRIFIEFYCKAATAQEDYPAGLSPLQEIRFETISAQPISKSLTPSTASQIGSGGRKKIFSHFPRQTKVEINQIITKQNKKTALTNQLENSINSYSIVRLTQNDLNATLIQLDITRIFSEYD